MAMKDVMFAIRDPYYKGKSRAWLTQKCNHYSNLSAHAYKCRDREYAAQATWLALGFRLELVARGPN